MIDFEHKGYLNQHVVLYNDWHNLSNRNNKQIYTSLIAGESSTPMLAYLLNYNKQLLHDAKSIMFYNQANLASEINEAKDYEPIQSDDASIVSLPKPDKKIRQSFSAVLSGRKSSRRFLDEHLEMKTLSTLLKYAFGLGKRRYFYGDFEASTRHYASGGGLYPIEIYLYVNKVSGIEKGIYHYQVYSHDLRHIRSADMVLEDVFIGDSIEVEHLHFAVFFQYQVNRNYLKYGELSLANTFLEVGGMSHNFDLVCEALGLSSCPIAGFDKTYVDRCLKQDGVSEHIVFTNICGRRGE